MNQIQTIVCGYTNAHNLSVVLWHNTVVTEALWPYSQKKISYLALCRKVLPSALPCDTILQSLTFAFTLRSCALQGVIDNLCPLLLCLQKRSGVFFLLQDKSVRKKKCVLEIQLAIPLLSNSMLCTQTFMTIAMA